MPKDNEVDEKVVNRYELSVSYGCPIMDESSDGEYVLYEDHAATVAELRAEVERLRAEWQASLGWKGAVVHGTRANIGVIADALTGADPT